MNTVERKQKLQTLPWYALHDIALQKKIDEKEINGKEKNTVIDKILSYGDLTDEEIEGYVNDYIYGDRVTFTLWTFQNSLKDSDYTAIGELENAEENCLNISGYRKLKILSVKEYDDRTEVLYVYSKEYVYIDENGQNANVWEQHRGCLWIGKTSTYLACISKHEKMTTFITKYIAEILGNSILQIKPPKSAIDKCTNFKAISRIVLQGKEGEKKMNAEKGRVPNIVYGYDKTIGDYFNLAINKEESKVVQQIYKWYTEEGYGAAKIANMLNEKGYKTKRNCKWSQNATCRILTNEIYTGKIINGKQEVSDFLTGQRRDKDETEWMVVERPELRIIEDETFEKAQEILRGRHDAFNLSHERQSNKHLFSTLIKCKECGWSFRRTVRTYKNTYVRWVCSGRNGRGVDSCPNKTVVDEEELIEVLQEYFTNVLKQKKKVIAHVVNEFQRVYKAKDENVEYEKELNAELAKLQKTRQKYMDMYTDDLISREELNEKIGGSRQEMERIENELKMVSYHLTKGEQLENILNNTFKEIEDITDVHQMTNQQLKRLIQKIEVDKDGNVDIYLRLLGDLGLDESVLIEENETVLNCDDQT